MKTIGRVLFLFFLALAAMAFFLPAHLARLAVNELARDSGLKVEFGRIEGGLLKPSVRIHKIVISNPPDFPHPEMLRIRELYVRYDIPSLFNRHKIIHEARLYIEQLSLVTTTEGRQNFQGLTGLSNSNTVKQMLSGMPSPDTIRDGGPVGDVIIGKLIVQVENIASRKYRPDHVDPVVHAAPVNFHRIYEHVTNLTEIGHALMMELYLRGDPELFEPLDHHKAGHQWP